VAQGLYERRSQSGDRVGRLLGVPWNEIQNALLQGEDLPAGRVSHGPKVLRPHARQHRSRSLEHALGAHRLLVNVRHFLET
jgi:hypothetical protein